MYMPARERLLSAQIKWHYGTTTTNNVVVTHPDKDHAEGLAPILEVTLAFQGGFVLFQTANCFGLRFLPVEQPGEGPYVHFCTFWAGTNPHTAAF